MTHLEKERKTASFDSGKLSKLFYTMNGEQKLDTFMKMQQILAEDPILKHDPADLGISRKELMTRMAKKAARFHELLGICNPLIFDYSHIIPHQVVGTVHNIMFAPTIQKLGTEEQVARFLGDAHSWRIFGTYAQTELGHGSDVQSLETTATYDPVTEEFVVNSPTISSTKWWPSELGVFATHAITHAQLYIAGKKYGVQTFVIQIRDLETHLPLKGIVAGDVGPKLGYNTKDNGFLRFDNVRVPRENMLMKYAKVSNSGQFSKAGNDKFAYATMMLVRLKLIESGHSVLSLVSTIATRYAAFRKQFKNAKGEEQIILDYQLHLNKLLPLLAATYAMNAASKQIFKIYNEMMSKIKEKNDFSMMAELHAILSGCKAFFTWETHNGIDVCRQACGGHGFSAYAGISLVFDGYSPNVTVEGDNTVMALQTARYLLKAAQNAYDGEKVDKSVEYLKNMRTYLPAKNCEARSKGDFGSLHLIDTALQINSIYLLSRVLTKVSTLAQEGQSLKEIWDKKAGIELFEAARAHIYQFTFSCFATMIREDVKDEKVAQVLRKLCLLYGIQKLLNHPVALFESGYFNPAQFLYMQKKKEDLLEELRPEALALTDAFAYRDESLFSALAVSDGKVYETLYEWASQKNYVNDGKPGEGFIKHIKPVMGKYSHLRPKL